MLSSRKYRMLVFLQNKCDREARDQFSPPSACNDVREELLLHQITSDKSREWNTLRVKILLWKFLLHHQKLSRELKWCHVNLGHKTTPPGKSLWVLWECFRVTISWVFCLRLTYFLWWDMLLWLNDRFTSTSIWWSCQFFNFESF